MSTMDGISATLDNPPAARTVQALDRELAQLRLDQDACADPQVAGAIEERCLQLEAERRILAAVTRAQQRREAAERARVGRETLAALEAELRPALRLQAVGLDEAVALLAERLSDIRTTLVRLSQVHDLPLAPVAAVREFDLGISIGRLDPGARLRECLARAGVLPNDLPRETREASGRTCEEAMVRGTGALFAAVRQRLVTDEDTHG